MRRARQLRASLTAVLAAASALFASLMTSEARPLGGEGSLPCSACPPGYEVATPCSGSRDTLCQPCPAGHYSNSSDLLSCFPCSRCGDQLFELHVCSDLHDVFCEICSWEYAKDNPDYIRKCLHKSLSATRGGGESVKFVKNEVHINSDTKGYDGMVGDQPVAGDSSAKEKVTLDKETKASFISKDPKSGKHDKPIRYEVTDKESKQVKPTYASVVSTNASTTPNSNLTAKETYINDKVLLSNQSEPSSVTVENSVLSTSDPEVPFTGTVEDVSSVSEASELATETGSGQLGEDSTYGYNAGNMEDVTSQEPSSSSAMRTSSPTFDQTTPSAFNGSVIVIAAQGIDNKPADGEGTSTFGIVAAALTSGVIFFAIGFFITRRSEKTKPQKISSICSRGHDPAMTWDDDVMCTSLQFGNEMYQELSVMSTEYTEMVAREPKPEVLQSGVPQVAVVPDNEDEKPPQVVGNYQSPVNIDPEEADVDEGLEKNPLFLKYIPENSKSLTNNGTLMRIEVDGTDSLLRGGPLNHRYQLDHLHFHWGASDDRGSEHTVKGMTFAAEVHFVHWNTDLYKSFAEAVKAESGLAIVGVLIEIGLQHKALKTITDALPYIRYKGESRDIDGAYFDPGTLLPDNTIDYWTYQGSMTIPPYYESVTWIVFKEPIEVSREQIGAFRKLLSYERDEDHGTSGNNAQGRITHNYRSTLPLGDRTVKASFA